MYLPKITTPYDLHEDKQPDVAFVLESPPDPELGGYYFIEETRGNINPMDNQVLIFEDQHFLTNSRGRDNA